jgi:TPR repeat protein
MRLVIKSNKKLSDMFPKEETFDYYEENMEYYDSKKLEQWERRYNELLALMKESDNREGIDLLFSLAEEGYPEARYQLSDMYLEGRGVPESLRKGVEWDRRARFAENFYREKPLG